jgi:hypothetical protein
VAVPVVAVLLVAVAVAFGLVYGIVVATLVVVIYGTVFSAIPVVGWKPFEALPEITVGLRVRGATVTDLERKSSGPQRPIDIDACVARAVQAARATVPARPVETRSPFDLLSVSAIDFKESYDEALKRFTSELEEFEAELQRWLEAYDQRRWPVYSLVKFPVAIHNSGQSVADAITVNLRIPTGWTALKEADGLTLPRPPKPPKFEQRASYRSPLSDLVLPTRAFPTFPEQSEGIIGPDYLQEGDHLVARLRIESLTHGDNVVSSDPLLLVPDAPGRHTINWTAHVGNLRRPARGEIIVEIEARAVPEDAPLRTLEEVLATNDVPIEK